MNKQEILNEIDKLVNTIAGIPFSTFMGYSHGETTAFTICRGLVERLDEPQKVKVPEFVAEWIEYVKKKGDSLYDSFKPWDLYGAEYVDADRWIAYNGEEYARAWLEGYEVEKEPKYYLVLPHITKMTHGHATKIHNVSTGITKDLANDTFLEQEIKDIDERYWAFAVPAEND